MTNHLDLHKKSVDNCPYRHTSGEDGCAICGLLQFLSGAETQYCDVDRSACEVCCRDSFPVPERPNHVVGSLLDRLADKAIREDGLPGCDVARARELKGFARGHLKMAQAVRAAQAPEKPWHYPVAVAIPHLDTPEFLEPAVRLWKLQDIYTYVIVIDTGSRRTKSKKLLRQLDKEDGVEVAWLNLNCDLEHLSDRVSIAMDYAFSRCPTEYLLAAHADAFPKHPRLASKLLEMCNQSKPVVGWQMSPRGPGKDGVKTGTLSDGCPGHVCTIFHMPMMDRVGAGWSMRRGHNAFGVPRRFTFTGWPDTEVCLGLVLRQVGITPLFLGRETNDEVQETEDWIHARSTTHRYMTQKRFKKAHLGVLQQAVRRLEQWQASPTTKRAWHRAVPSE